MDTTPPGAPSSNGYLPVSVPERARYRITGALFLLAMAAIFVPMLFDGEGVPTQTLKPMQTMPTEDLPAAGKSHTGQSYGDIVPDSDVVSRVSALRAEVDAEGYSTLHGTRFGEPQLMPVNEDTDMWAVQAGSFAQFENAQNFRTTVRDLGYEAFISSAKDPSGRLRHRVAVGPLLELSDANRIRDALEAQLDVAAQIMEMQL